MKKLMLAMAASIAAVSAVVSAKEPVPVLAEAVAQTATTSAAEEGEGLQSALDELEAKYDDAIRDQTVFGISVGTLIAIAVSVLWKAIAYAYERKWKGKISSAVQGDSEAVSKIDRRVEAISSEIDRLIESHEAELEKARRDYESLVKSYEDWARSISSRIEAAADEISDNAAMGSRVREILRIAEEFAKSPEAVKSGVAAKIAEGRPHDAEGN